MKWKVFYNVRHEQLEEMLNDFSGLDWTVHSIFQESNGDLNATFTLIIHRPNGAAIELCNCGLRPEAHTKGAHK